MVLIQQIRAGRAMLNLSQKQLAAKAGISIATLNNIERGVQTDPKLSTVRAIQEALEAEGIEFLHEDNGCIGLMLRPKHQATKAATILLVDDSKADRMLFRNWLVKQQDRRYVIVEADNAMAGFDAFVNAQPDCVILDFMMYGTDGFQLLARLQKANAKLPPIIFVTGMQNDELRTSAKARGVFAYLNKQTLTHKELCHVVASALKK